MLVEQYKEGFDALMTTDDHGEERWSARDLQSHLGYSRWEYFENAIDRAKISIQALNMDVTSQVRDAPKLLTRGDRRGTQKVSDYSLTRFGAYMVAMNGDPRKTEIAQAQAYFAVQTRMAETQGMLEELKEAREKIKDLDNWIGADKLIERQRLIKEQAATNFRSDRILIDHLKERNSKILDENERHIADKAGLQSKLDSIRAALRELL